MFVLVCFAGDVGGGFSTWCAHLRGFVTGRRVERRQLIASRRS